MKKILLNRLISSIIASFIFIGGIISLIIGIKIQMPLLVYLGIGIIVLGIYVLPLVWFNYIAWRGYSKIYECIINKDSITTFDITKILNKKDKDITKGVRLLFDYDLLKEYRFIDNSKIIKNKK